MDCIVHGIKESTQLSDFHLLTHSLTDPRPCRDRPCLSACLSVPELFTALSWAGSLSPGQVWVFFLGAFSFFSFALSLNFQFTKQGMKLLALGDVGTHRDGGTEAISSTPSL